MLAAYLLAYCAQRLGEMHVATFYADRAEQPRLHCAHRHYGQQLQHWLLATGAVTPRAAEPAADSGTRLVA